MKRPRAWNSTIPVPKERMARTRPIAARGARKAKKEKRYDAFMASPEWKKIRRGAIRRAGYRCAYLTYVEGKGWKRCKTTEHLHVHHKTYARFGGGELPSDLIVYCKAHHELVEA